MSGIALALLKKKFTVSGSDPVKNDRINELNNNGAIIFEIQNKTNIDLITKKFKEKRIIIVVSSAIKNSNEELNYCIKRNFIIKHRSEILSKIMESYKSIGVAGSHGKTTTSSLITTLLDFCTKDASSIIGGVIPTYESNTLIKNSKFLVTEIDESDGTTKNYYPSLGIITNIDFDHCDYYANLNQLTSSFNQFGLNSNNLLTNFDCKITQENIESNYRYSLKETKGIDFSMIPKKFNYKSTVADYYEKEKLIKTLNIPIPGLHNLANVTAAISACRINNINIKDIIKNIKFLQLPKRRFEIRGNIFERTLVDDYGHHPSEIKATIELGRLYIKNKSENKKRLVLIFQPHRYSRAKKFLSDFVKELAKADLIIITNIYSAGETDIKDINSRIIADKIFSINRNIKFLNNINEIVKEFFKLTKKGDLVINMGAGDSHDLWELLKSN